MCVNFCIDAKTDYKESTSTPDESDPQYKESGIEEEFPKNPELKGDLDHDLRYGKQQICHQIIKAPYLLVVNDLLFYMDLHVASFAHNTVVSVCFSYTLI